MQPSRRQFVRTLLAGSATLPVRWVGIRERQSPNVLQGVPWLSTRLATGTPAPAGSTSEPPRFRRYSTQFFP